MPLPSFLQFKSPPKPFVPGAKNIRTKTVDQVLGSAFDYSGAIRSNSTFCKKFLKYCANEFSTENVLFLLVCEKYRKNPSDLLFFLIYEEFVAPSAAREINIGSATANKLRRAANGNVPATLTIFDDAVTETEANVSDTINRLKEKPFDTAFLLSGKTQADFDNAVNYLRRIHQIVLV